MEYPGTILATDLLGPIVRLVVYLSALSEKNPRIPCTRNRLNIHRTGMVLSRYFYSFRGVHRRHCRRWIFFFSLPRDDKTS